MFFSHAKELEEIGLDIPEVTKIASKLADNGLPVDRSIYTVEALFGCHTFYKERRCY